MIPTILLLSLAMTSAPESQNTFLRRAGTELRFGEKPFRSVGVNKFDLFLRFLEGGDQKKQALSAMEQAAKQDITVIRFAGVGFYPRQMTHWANESLYWGAFDELVQSARKSGIKLIPVLNWNLYLFPDMASECVQDMLTNPDSRSRQYLWLYTHQIVSRYQDEPTILFWELTNEMNLSADLEFIAPYGRSDLNPVHEGTPYMRLRRDHFTTEQMIPFLKEWAAFIRQLDKNHLISTGFSAPRPAAQHLRLARGKGDWTADSEQELETYLRDTHPDPIDLISIHFYRRHDNLRLGNQAEVSAAPLANLAQAAKRVGKPLYIGETGDDYEKYPNAPFLKNVLDESIHQKIPIILVWNWMSPGDSYDVNPTRTPHVVTIMKEVNQAFKTDIK